MKNSKLKNVCYNFLSSSLSQIILIFLRFFSRTIFIKYLGESYLGINGLFSNILSILSLAELGIGSAIVYSMYEPLAKNDYIKVYSLMNYYKKLYICISLIIFILGCLIMPFLPLILNLSYNIDNIYIYYLLYLASTSLSYLFVYKTTILYADQKDYVLKLYGLIAEIILVFIQCFILIKFHNYLFYLIVQTIFPLITNFLLSKKAEQLYFKDKPKLVCLNDKEKKDIWSNVKSIFSYKVGGIILNNTDQILISTLISTEMVGFYSNYLILINSLSSFTSVFFHSVKASIGHLVTEQNKEKEYNVFSMLDLLAFWIYGFCSICFVLLANDFIDIWIGKKYILSVDIVLVVAISYYITGILYPIFCYRETIGLFKDTKNILFYSSVINLILSIVLGNKYGLVGILFATILARVCTNLWYEPYKLFTNFFHKKFTLYIVIQLKNVLIIIFTYIIVNLFIRYIIIDNVLIEFIVKAIVCFVLINLLFLILLIKDFRFTLLKNYLIEVYRKKVKN